MIADRKLAGLAVGHVGDQFDQTMTMRGRADTIGTMRPGQGWFARLSLAQKVPLVAGGLILVVAAAGSSAAYFKVRSIARQSAYQHMQDVVQLIGSTSQRTGTGLIAAAHAVAVKPAVATFLKSPDATRRSAALAALLTRTGGGSSTLLATQLIDGTGQVVLTTNPAVEEVPSDFPATVSPDDTGSVGRIRLLHDSIVYPVSASVPGVPGAYVVQWRHATTSPRSNQGISQLIGAGATLLMGNADGSFWTDFSTRVAPPPVDPRQWKGLIEYTRDPAEGRVIAGELPLGGTPTVVAVEFPLRAVMQPVDAFLRGLVLITVACVALGLLAAWWFARRLTVPLLELTDAADTIAAGRDHDPIQSNRADELGRLAASFEVMSRQVRDARQRLEERVSERTDELHVALNQLQTAQEALVRREKLAMLGQLAGGVGHELRNPLGVMNNAIYYLELVLHSSPENVRDYLRLLREQVALSSKIVGDLLDFARITPANRKPVTVRSIVEAQVARLQDTPHVRVENDLRESLPSVDVDAVHIGQVVFNLLTNAVQAMGESGGRIKISAAANGSGMVELRIADSGPGIPPELVDRIFEPLFTTKARGIGLGLAVSQALAHANDSSISVTSTPGYGATFVVSMPAAVGVMA